MKNLIFKRIGPSSLQLAALFAYSVLLLLSLIIALGAFADPLHTAGLLTFYDGFWESTGLTLLLPCSGAFLFYACYKAKRLQKESVLPALSAGLLSIVLVLALSDVILAFTQYVLVMATIVYFLTWITYRLPVSVRGWAHGIAILLAFISIGMVAIEGFLLRQFVSARSSDASVLDFGDITSQDSPGRLQPNLNDSMRLGDGSIGRVITNARGFRNKTQLVLPKPEREFRILFLGDSFTFGFRTDQLKTAAAILESKLRSDLRLNVRVYPGWTENQNGLVSWLRQYPNRFDADLILHGICLGNDLGTTFWTNRSSKSARELAETIPARFLDMQEFREDTTFVKGSEPEELKSRLRTSAAIRFLFLPTPIYTGQAVQPGRPPLWNPQNDIGLFLKDPSFNSELFDTFAERIQEADRLLEIPLHSVLFPQRYQQSELEWRAMIRYYGLRSEAFDLGLPNRKILDICKRNRLNCVDLLPAFREHSRKLLHYPYDMHWNDAGNRLAGEAMAKYLAPVIRKELQAAYK